MCRGLPRSAHRTRKNIKKSAFGQQLPLNTSSSGPQRGADGNLSSARDCPGRTWQLIGVLSLAAVLDTHKRALPQWNLPPPRPSAENDGPRPQLC
jgi:hypothetical protein